MDAAEGTAPRGPGPGGDVPAALGVRAIIRYKEIKAVVELALAALLSALIPLGLATWLRDIALAIERSAVHAWALHVSRGLLDGDSPRHLWYLALALGLDGTLTAFEAFALRSGRWWGHWVVVVATGCPLPFEVYEIVRDGNPLRVAVFIVNASIVLYLARRALRHRS